MTRMDLDHEMDEFHLPPEKPFVAAGAVVYEDREPTLWERIKRLFGLWEPLLLHYRFKKSPGPIPPGTYETRIESVQETGNSLTIVFGDVKQIENRDFGSRKPMKQYAPRGTHSNGEEENGN